MLQPKSSLKTAILATLGAVMLCALILLVWLGKNSVPTLWDQGRHTGLSYYYFNTLKLHGISHFIGALAHYNYYPPFYYLPSLPLYAVFGLHDATAIASNLIYLALLALFTFLSTYKLSERKPGAALIAAVLVITFPFLSYQTKEFMPDVALTAVLACGFWLLLKTDQFSKPKWSLLWGASLGVGMLVKWTYAFYWIIPISWYLICYWSHGFRSRKLLVTASLYLVANLGGMFWLIQRHGPFSSHSRFPAVVGLAALLMMAGGVTLLVWLNAWSTHRSQPFNLKQIHHLLGQTLHHQAVLPLLNLCASLVTGAIVSGWWYVPNFGDLYRDFVVNAFSAGAREGDPAISTFAAWTHYLKDLLDTQLFPLLTLLAILAACWYCYRAFQKKPIPPGIQGLLMILISGFIMLNLIQNKDARYFLPLMVGFAILIALWWDKCVKNGWLKYSLVVLMLIRYCWQFFGTPAVVMEMVNIVDHNLWQRPLLVNFIHSHTWKPRQLNMPTAAIVQAIINNCQASDAAKPKVLLILGNEANGDFNDWNIAKENDRIGTPLIVAFTPEVLPPATADCVLLARQPESEQAWQKISATLPANLSFVVAASWQLPENFNLELIKIDHASTPSTIR